MITLLTLYLWSLLSGRFQEAGLRGPKKQPRVLCIFLSPDPWFLIAVPGAHPP